MYKLFFLLFIAQFAYGEDIKLKIIQDKIAKIEKDMSILQKEFFSEQMHREQNSSLKQNYLVNVADSNIEIRTSEIEENIRQLNGEIEKLNHIIDKLKINNYKLKQDYDFRLNKIEQQQKLLIKKPNKKANKKHKKNERKNTNKIKNKKNKKITKNKKPTKVTKNTLSIKQEFDIAYQLYQSKKLKQAKKLFVKFIANHNKDQLAGEAYYWIGEIFLVNTDFDSAALNYIYSYKKYPNSAKAPFALFKLSTTLAKLGKQQESCNVIRKLFINFKNKLPRALNRLATQHRNRLKCDI